MTTLLKKYNLSGKQLGEVTIDESIASAEANGQMVKDYIIALRRNARQWSACTKTRAEVAHTTKKPHPQKGTGRARQGMLSAPQYRGGGRVFGPRPKFDQHMRVNRKERRAAIRALLAEKIREEKILILDSTTLDSPKTKLIAGFIKTLELTGRVLFLGEGMYAEVEAGEDKHKVSVRCDMHKNFCMSVKNLPKTTFSLVSNISGYDVMIAHQVVMTEGALAELQEWLV